MKRRSFLSRSGGAIGGSWIAMSWPLLMATAGVACKARDEKSEFRVLTNSEAREFEAIAAQIIPSGDTPGAIEAGVIYFMDTALADVSADALEPMRQGLVELQKSIPERYNTESFASLVSDQQIAVLHGIEETDFFASVRYLTLAGMFSHPSHGGNRNEAGWKLIGFEAPQAWQPPFGYYDADYAKKGA